MSGTIELIIVLAVYGGIAYLGTRLTRELTLRLNLYLRILIRSFVYALLFGFGIAASGGDPGFGFPAPNLVAIILMTSIGFYKGAVTGIYILLAWWVLIMVVMFTRQAVVNRQAGKRAIHRS